VLDFSSSLYLGLRHGSRLLPAWTELSAGKPAAMAEPTGALRVGRTLAALQGCEDAVLAPSTLHLFWDLLAMLARDRPAAIFIDSGSYPIARWGAERARLQGTVVSRFRHHDVEALRSQMRRTLVRPIVVGDGICPGCGRMAPVGEYARAVEEQGGMLVIDDTQALGLLGERATRHPWGEGGGGSLRYHGVAGSRVLVVSSFAKAFGVPVAALSGGVAAVRQFVERSETRLHCSPPSVPVILAAERALRLNARIGDALRDSLLRRIRQLRAGLRDLGLEVERGLFPMQTLEPSSGVDPAALYARLRARGIATVLRAARRGEAARLTFILTAAHAAADIDAALSAVAEGTRRSARNQSSPRRYTGG
jgi:8-amino-7-oxononanoate synthase